jgi:hypothetical protein
MAGLAVVAGQVPSAVGAPAGGRPLEITETPRGRALAQEVAARHSGLGLRTTAGQLKVWRIGADDYLVGRSLPDELVTTGTRRPDGSTDIRLSYAVGARDIVDRPGRAATRSGVAPSWSLKRRACFSRLGSEYWGFVDSCYVIEQLINETDAKDYYKLEQYGTVAAGRLTKMYDGWLKAAKASSGSASMSWIDWNPRGSASGPCHDLTLTVSALGLAFSTPAFFCENNIPTKSAAAGSFQMMWSCGCVYPFGQPYPNSREIKYLQVVSVPNGGAVRWTLSAGYNVQ